MEQLYGRLFPKLSESDVHRDCDAITANFQTQSDTARRHKSRSPVPRSGRGSQQLESSKSPKKSPTKTLGHTANPSVKTPSPEKTKPRPNVDEISVNDKSILPASTVRLAGAMIDDKASKNADMPSSSSRNIKGGSTPKQTKSLREKVTGADASQSHDHPQRTKRPLTKE